MNLETFNKEVAPTAGKYKITSKGFYHKFQLQSIYKTEFPFNNEYERFFVINDNVYKLSDFTKSQINQAFKEEKDILDIVFRKNERTTFVNVPFDRFILVNEQVTDNLIYAKKPTNEELPEGWVFDKHGVAVPKDGKSYDNKGNLLEVKNPIKKLNISDSTYNMETGEKIEFKDVIVVNEAKEGNLDSYIEQKLNEENTNKLLSYEESHPIVKILTQENNVEKFVQEAYKTGRNGYMSNENQEFLDLYIKYKNTEKKERFNFEPITTEDPVEIETIKKAYTKALKDLELQQKIKNLNIKHGITEEYEQEQLEKWSKIDAAIEKEEITDKFYESVKAGSDYDADKAQETFKNWNTFRKDFKNESSKFSSILEGINEMLDVKDKRYGNAINNRLEIFEGKCNGGQRLDEKLSRIKNSEELRLNDVVDTIGFLILTIQEKGWNKEDILKLID